MGWLFKRFEEWDRVSLTALGIALILLVMVVLMVVFGPADLRQPAIFGLIGLVVMTQIIIMWGNRGMVTPFQKAQNAFVDGDFETACTILEDLRESGQANMHALTLLGNTYRMLGFLDESEVALREALDIEPNHYFPLYGFGRTLLAKGRYDAAAEALEQALAAGAPPVIQFDLGHARYRQGRLDDARNLLQDARSLTDEPYRLLMIDYLLYRLATDSAPVRERIAEGLPYWRASAERHHHTPYGEALSHDIHHLEALLKEH